jgi:RHS repeat-associated protein
LTYEYDKASNRTKIGGSFARTGIPQAISSTVYNAANHQTTFGGSTLTYDNNGNLQTITDANGTTTYTWNARNQLVGINGPGVSASFVYDGLGRREKKIFNSTLTEFLFDGVNPVQETSGVAILANILPGFGIDEFLTRTDVGASATSFLLSDALGSSIALTDAAGAIQTEYIYEPFGKTTVTGASNTNALQFTGRENDGTVLYYYRARYYHPVLQRFMSEDPIEFYGGDVNLYAYVGNDPNNFIDPDGLRFGWGGRGGYRPGPWRQLPSQRNTGPRTPGPETPQPQPRPVPDPRQPHPFPGPEGGEAPHHPWQCVFVPWNPACGGHGGGIPPVPPQPGRKDQPPVPDHPVCRAAPELCPDPWA